MDNPQETLKSYITGLFEGEGTVALYQISQRNMAPQIRAHIQFTNTDADLIRVFASYLKSNGWNYHIRTDKRPKNRLMCYSITVNKVNDRKLFLDDLMPYMVGEKKEIAKIVRDFCQHRANVHEQWKKERGTDGRYKSGAKTSYSEIDIQFYNEYKSFKGSSETKRKTAVMFG